MKENFLQDIKDAETQANQMVKEAKESLPVQIDLKKKEANAQIEKLKKEYKIRLKEIKKKAKDDADVIIGQRIEQINREIDSIQKNADQKKEAFNDYIFKLIMEEPWLSAKLKKSF